MWVLYSATRVFRNGEGRAIKLTPNEAALVQAIVKCQDLNSATVRANGITSSRARVAMSRMRAKFTQAELALPFFAAYGTQQYKLTESVEIRRA